MMVIFYVVLLFLGVVLFDFLPQYKKRRKKRGLWLYSLFLAISFCVLILVGAGVEMDLAWLFGL